MGAKRIADQATILLVGDGVVGFAAPRRHSPLWNFGPKGYRRSVEAGVRHTLLTRLFSAAEIGLGPGLACRQYAKE